MQAHDGDYAAYEIGWGYEEFELSWGYEAMELVYELDQDTRGYDLIEVQDGAESVRVLERGGFSEDEEAFFCSDVNPVLVIEEPLDTLGDRAQAALSRFTQRARALIHSTPAQASS